MGLVESVLFIMLLYWDEINRAVGSGFTDKLLTVYGLDHGALLEFYIWRELGEAVECIVYEAVDNAN